MTTVRVDSARAKSGNDVVLGSVVARVNEVGKLLLCNIFLHLCHGGFVCG